MIVSVHQVLIAIKRLNKFFANEELDPDNVRELHPSESAAVKITDGNFAWGKEDELCLKKVNIEVQPGKLVAVVGQVGAGKSSLCAAMLGLMDKRTGDVGIRGKVAYVPQQVKKKLLFFAGINLNQVSI